MDTLDESLDLFSSLREANQRLVIATLKAQELQEAAEASYLRQKEFLYMLAHELRNPLAPLAMVCHMLGKVALQHPGVPQLPIIQGTISRQVGHMTRLVEDLLEASRVHSGKIVLHKKPVLLSRVLQSAAESSQSMMEQRGQTLQIDWLAEPVLIEGDEVRLAQIFSNLLANAARYSGDNDTFLISMRLESGQIAVSVKDHGTGIELADQEAVFDLFVQGPRTLDRMQGGLGIGLSLVRVLSELHGGAVKVISAGQGQGCEFVVTLPLSTSADATESVAQTLIAAHNTEQALDAAKKAAATAATQEPPVSKCLVLVIEDNVDANEILCTCLRLDGFEVASAFDGMAGVAMAEQLQPDVLLCDIGLPLLDGFGVVSRLRKNNLLARGSDQGSPADKALPPYCIAISGYHQQDYQTRALKAGFDHYLVKPVELESLTALIEKTCPAKVPLTAQAALAESPASPTPSQDIC